MPPQTLHVMFAQAAIPDYHYRILCRTPFTETLYLGPCWIQFYIFVIRKPK